MKKFLYFITTIGFLVLLLAIYAFVSFKPPKPAQPLSDRFVLQNITIVHPGEEQRTEGNLAVADGRFTEDTLSEATTFDDFNGCYVLPGLVDMHAHLPGETPLKLGDYFMLLHIAHGVTAIRGAGDTDGTANPGLKAAMESGELFGPRLYTSGYFVASEEVRWTNTLLMEGPEDAEKIVQQIADEGNQFIKAYENLKPEMIKALVAEAEKRDMGVLGHIPFELTIEEAMVPDIQHLMGVVKPEDISEDSILARISEWDSVDETRLDSVTKFCQENDLANTPTLALGSHILRYRDYANVIKEPDVQLLPPFYSEIVWHPEEGLPLYRGMTNEDFDRLEDAVAKKQTLVKKLHDAGAQLYLGTDTQQPFSVPGAGLHTEIHAFLDAGVPLEDTLRYATTASYEALPGEKKLGRVEPGFLADAVVYREDPTKSPDALKSIVAVIVDGNLFRKSDLDKKIQEYQDFYRGALVARVSETVARGALEDSVAGQ